jgi:peptide/nickel transport system substrate-binding protein
MQHAINREELVAATFGPEECKPSVQPWPPEYWAYNANIGPDRFAHDPALSRRLLAEAGLPNGFGFTLEVSNVTAYPPVAEVLRAQFGAVGIDMQIRVTESAQVRENFQVSKSSDAALGVWGGSLDPSEYIAASHLPGGSYNPGDLETPGVAEFAAAGLEATDTEERAPIYQEMTDVLFGEEQPGSQIVLCNRTSVRVNSPQLALNGAGVLLSGAYDWRYLTKSAS